MDALERQIAKGPAKGKCVVEIAYRLPAPVADDLSHMCEMVSHHVGVPWWSDCANPEKRSEWGCHKTQQTIVTHNRAILAAEAAYELPYPGTPQHKNRERRCGHAVYRSIDNAVACEHRVHGSGQTASGEKRKQKRNYHVVACMPHEHRANGDPRTQGKCRNQGGDDTLNKRMKIAQRKDRGRSRLQSAVFSSCNGGTGSGSSSHSRRSGFVTVKVRSCDSPPRRSNAWAHGRTAHFPRAW